MKKLILFFLLITSYGVLALANHQYFSLAITSNLYFFRELITIMPVVFMMIILIDIWIPKEKLVTYLGPASGVKGILLSFALGSLSAGPIYAAFPIVQLLYQKGTSTKNVTIILSSWAVIKVPMLLNEARFISPSYMLARWLLSIVMILVISSLTARFSSIESPREKSYQIANSCRRCDLCLKSYPDHFTKEEDKIVITGSFEGAQGILSICPFGAIREK